MENDIKTCAKFLLGVVPLPFLFQMPVADSGKNIQIIISEINIYFIIKIAVDKGGITENPVVVNVIPSQSTGSIAPV